jgi:hypothetical protein
MLYRRFFKLKEDTQNITDLEATHWYLRSLEGTPTFHAKVLQGIFVEFGNSYTLLDVYNISEKLELVHAHYEANIMRPPSHSRPLLPPVAPTKSSYSSSRAKMVHLAAPILPSCNYCGNPAHKAMSATFLPKIFFVIIVGKRAIEKLFILPSSQNGSNFDYHSKVR